MSELMSFEKILVPYDASSYANHAYDEALKIHKKLEPMHNALFIETSPSPVKYVLSKMGLIEDELRLPLVSIRQETKEILDKIISDLDLI